LNFKIAIKNLFKDYWGTISLVYILIITVISIFAYWISPDSSPNANQMNLKIHSKPPGFSTFILKNPKNFKSDKLSLPNNEIYIEDFKIVNNKFFYSEVGSFSKDQKQIDISEILKDNDIEEFELKFIKKITFYLGTDKYGRDMLSRMIIGSRVSISIGFVAVIISLIIGILIGLTSGYFGGWFDDFIVWLINVFWAIPTLLLVIAITISLGKGYWQVFFAVGLTMWVEVARLVRGQVRTLKEKLFIQSAQVLGFSNYRIMLNHVLPNLLGPLIVISAANFASAILIESGLSFLGIGVQPPVPSWGGMVKDHFRYIILGKEYLAILPGLAIMSLVLSFMILGNSLRDAFDVRN
tara:strand:+ start:85 stop:1143 length:1059 start_codon:yes stop_codon:yes gene_type:complete